MLNCIQNIVKQNQEYLQIHCEIMKSFLTYGNLFLNNIEQYKEIVI